MNNSEIENKGSILGRVVRAGSRIGAAVGLTGLGIAVFNSNAQAKNLGDVYGVTPGDKVQAADYVVPKDTATLKENSVEVSTVISPENVPSSQSLDSAESAIQEPVTVNTGTVGGVEKSTNVPAINLDNSIILKDFYTELSSNFEAIPGITLDSYISKIGFVTERKVQGDGSVLYNLSNGGRIITASSNTGKVLFESVIVGSGSEQPLTKNLVVQRYGTPFRADLPMTDANLNLGTNGATDVYDKFAIIYDKSTGAVKEIQGYQQIQGLNDYLGSKGWAHLLIPSFAPKVA